MPDWLICDRISKSAIKQGDFLAVEPTSTQPEDPARAKTPLPLQARKENKDV